MNRTYPKTLAGFNYAFNDNGELRQLDPESREMTDQPFDFSISEDFQRNQEHYDALGEVITEEVYNMLIKEGLHKVYLPKDVPEDEATFVFSNKPNADFTDSEKVLVLVHGSGVVRAGQWARSLIINHSINHGTQIPYIRQAMSLGYDVLIANTNYNRQDGKPIRGSESATAHGCYLWENLIAGNQRAKNVAFVVHSYGGVVAHHLVRKYPEEFVNKVFAVAMTDSAHMKMTGETGKMCQRFFVNWIASRKPVNTPIQGSSDDIRMYSAGHDRHEWTTYTCQKQVFDFLEHRYKQKIEAQEQIALIADALGEGREFDGNVPLEEYDPDAGTSSPEMAPPPAKRHNKPWNNPGTGRPEL